MKADILNRCDIKLLVDSFYEEVQKDVLLGGIFQVVINDWKKHLEKMYTFWETVLLGEHSYHGSPFRV